MNILRFLLVIILGLSICYGIQQKPQLVNSIENEFSYLYIPAHAAVDSPISIRVLILAHSTDIHPLEAPDIIKTVKNAADKGLNIKIVGNYMVRSTDEINSKVKEAIRIDASPGDTLIVYTCGHGSPQGHLAGLGKRVDVMKAILAAAEEGQQETVWWQLSCHAGAALPKIEELTPQQQDIFSQFASSSSSEVSWTGTQHEIWGKVFDAMIAKKPIDTNEDEIITAGELRAFLNTVSVTMAPKNMGELFFARSNDETIFGKLLHLFPIINHSGPQERFDNNYIPVPRIRT